MRRGLTYGFGKGLALGKQRRRTLREVRLLTPAQMKAQSHPMGCVCDDKPCVACTPDPEPAIDVDHPAGSSQPVTDSEKGDDDDRSNAKQEQVDHRR